MIAMRDIILQDRIIELERRLAHARRQGQGEAWRVAALEAERAEAAAALDAARQARARRVREGAVR